MKEKPDNVYVTFFLFESIFIKH